MLGLWGFACTQPILSVLGDEPSFFIFRQTSRVAAILFAVGLAVVPPLVLLGLNLVADRVDRRFGRAVHLAIVGGLATLALHVILRRMGLTNAIASVALALALGLAFTLAYRSVEAVATWARYTAVLPALAVPTFLFLAPSSEVFSTASSQGETSEATDEPSVVFLVLDELPTKSLLDDEDHIDPVRFPNLAGFADDSTWYRGHSTVADATRQAVPAILTGLVPSGEEAMMQNHPDNLFTLLRPTHDMRVSESRTWLCGFEGCRGSVSESASLTRQLRTMATGASDLWRDQVLPGPWEEPKLDDFEEDLVTSSDGTQRPRNMNAPVVSAPERFVDFLDTIEPTDQPTLWYQHLLMPHQPWHVYPDGEEYENPEEPRWSDEYDTWWRATQEQQHLFQAQYADRLVGELLDRVKDAGLYEDSLIVVVADHGISFSGGTSPRMYAEPSADGVAFSPLLIKAPGQSDGAIDDQAIESFDILPTVADLLGIEVPWDTDGVPAGSPEIAARGTTRTIYDFGSIDDPEPRKTAHFEDAEHLPSAANRWIRPIGPDEPPLIGLMEVAASARWLGADVDDITSTVAGTARVDGIHGIEDPATSPRPGFIAGTVEGQSGPGRVLVAVNGAVVTASPALVYDGDTTFRAMLPPGLSQLDDIEIRLVWVPGRMAGDASGMIELEVVR